MNEKITERIANKYLTLRSVDGGATAIQQRLGFYPDHFRCQAYCEGYLEGIEKAKCLEEALNKIDRYELDPRLGQIVDVSHYEKAFYDCADFAGVALAQWKKEK